VYILLAVFLFAKRKYPVYFTCFVAIGLCAALAASWTEPLQDECRVTVMDVGQGQCILVQSEGKNYLVDCGSYSDSYAADQAAGLLLSQGIARLDGVILTHFDIDHAGGVSYLLTRVTADKLFLPNCLDEDSTSESLYSYTGGAVETISIDTVLSFGETKITMIPSENAVSNNESGLCILFQTKNCDILITGDRSAAGERELIKHMALPDLELLIVGHHGSKTSTCRELLIITKPDVAIISVGADNSYGHPTQEVLDRLTYYGCRIYRTDLDGTVIFRG
jgi:competence protein ComEC